MSKNSFKFSDKADEADEWSALREHGLGDIWHHAEAWHEHGSSDLFGPAVPMVGLASWNDGAFLLTGVGATGGGFGATTGGAGTGGTTVTPGGTTGAAATKFVINLKYDASAAAMPAAMKAALAAAANYFMHLFANTETVNLTVGYGKVGTTTLGAGTLGAAGPYGITETYAAFKAQIGSHITSADQQTVYNNMGADPTNGGKIFLATAEAKALGLLSTYTSTDGIMGFAKAWSSTNTSGVKWDYDPSNGITAGNYDFYGVALHEIAHALGRIAILGSPAGQYSAMDLFRYSGVDANGNGVHSLKQTTPAYFSIDGGKTNLDWYSTTSDLGDWAASAGNDANNAYAASGVVNSFTHTDVVQMNALGFALL